MVLRLPHALRRIVALASLTVLVLPTGCVSQGKYNELRTRYETEVEGLRSALQSLERAKGESERDSEYYRTLSDAKAAENESLKAKLNLAEVGAGGAWESDLRKAIGNVPGVELIGGGKGTRFDADLLFPAGSADLSRGGAGALDPLVALVREQGLYVQIDGHTDSDPIKRTIKVWKSGSNFELGAHRALAVLLHLQQRGIPADHMFLASYGEHRPLDPSSKSRNRRVELYFFKAGSGSSGGGGLKQGGGKGTDPAEQGS